MHGAGSSGWLLVALCAATGAYCLLRMRSSVEEQRRLGGRPEVCSVFKYQYYLFEKEDKALDELAERCRKGEILCGECKQLLTQRINEFLIPDTC